MLRKTPQIHLPVSLDISQEWLDRVGPPFGFLSLQHFNAILKRCAILDPDPQTSARRIAAFEHLVEGARTINGQWRTFSDRDGRTKETHFPSARSMVASPEFSMDTRRYDEHVSLVPAPTMLKECASFEQLVSQALSSR